MCVTKINQNYQENGRSGEIRTPGPLVPNQMRYQAALHSDCGLFTPNEMRFASAKNAFLGCF